MIPYSAKWLSVNWNIGVRYWVDDESTSAIVSNTVFEEFRDSLRRVKENRSVKQGTLLYLVSDVKMHERVSDHCVELNPEMTSLLLFL